MGTGSLDLPEGDAGVGNCMFHAEARRRGRGCSGGSAGHPGHPAAPEFLEVAEGVGGSPEWRVLVTESC